MASADSPSEPLRAERWRAVVERWNRKLHYYSGLFLLFFIWLFAFSGLLLNHPSWTADFWAKRKEKIYDAVIVPPDAGVQGDLAQAHDVMKQLGIDGEILWTVTRTDRNQFEFQVRRPGDYFFIKADFTKKTASVRKAEVNMWGIIRVLHTFSGVQLDDPRNRRDWALTFVWAYSMDAVAVGLIFMVFSSIFMWLELRTKRLGGGIALTVGSMACGLFCFALRWFF